MKLHLILPTLKEYLCGRRRLDPMSHYVLMRLNELWKALNSQKITIMYHPKNENEKKRLIEIINFLNQRGKDVTVMEYERIFEDDLLLELAKRNFDFKICLRYMLESYHSANNLEMEYSLEQYQEILKKVKYFKEKVEENCTTEEEKAFFAIHQLATYIKYSSMDIDINRLNELELTPVSDFYASIGRGEAVCVGYSMAFWKILTDLKIPCHIMLGTVPYEGQNVAHAWNQVCINGIWYNIDLTVYANGQNIRNLLQDDQNFVAHSPYSENKKEPCLLQYPRERILYFLERMKSSLIFLWNMKRV